MRSAVGKTRQQFKRTIRAWEKDFTDTHDGTAPTNKDKQVIKVWYKTERALRDVLAKYDS